MLNVILCDDCLQTLDLIKEIIETFFKEQGFEKYQIHCFTFSNDVIEFAQNHVENKNIYILDVNLNEERNGILLGKEIRNIDQYKSIMIFVTNHFETSYKVFQYKLQVLEFIDKNYNLSKSLKESLLIATNVLMQTKKTAECKNLSIKIASEVIYMPIDDIVLFLPF